MGILLAGCSAFAPQLDPTRFFVLATSPARDVHVDRAGLRIGLGPITLPPYLDRAGIVTRVGEHQIHVSPTDRWGEPLAAGLWSALAHEFAVRLGTREIVPYPWYATNAPNLQVRIDLSRFEATDRGRARLEARWALVDPRKERDFEVRVASHDVPVAGDGTAERTDALSEAVSRLAKEIATAILATLETQAPAAG